MKKLIILLLFIPLVSFGQNKYSVYQKNDTNNYTTSKALSEASQMLGNLAKQSAAKREAEAKRLGYSSASAYALKLKRERKSYRKNKKLLKKNKKLSNKQIKKFSKELEDMIITPRERAKILKDMFNSGEITKKQYNLLINRYNKILNQ